MPLMPHKTPFRWHPWGPLGTAWILYSLYGRMPDIRIFVDHDPQKLLPAPSPFNRPVWEFDPASMNLWDAETLQNIMRDMTYERMADLMFPKACKPDRYYIEGGHFDMLPPGTVDPEDEWINFEGTPTGRLTPFFPPSQREKSEPWPHKMAVIDLAGVEARVLTHMLARQDVKAILIDIESSGGEIGPSLDLYDYVKPSHEQVAKRQPPSYLRHDPTKRHSRRRKRK